MSDTVTNLVGHADPRGAAATGIHNAKAPLSDLFAEVLSHTTFSDQMPAASQFGLTRAADRDVDIRDVDDDAPDDADAAASDSEPAEVSETDEPANDGDETQGEDQTEAQADSGDEAGTQSAALPDEALLATGTESHDGQNPGLTAQPNAASGVELKSKAEGATPGQSRVVGNHGKVQAAAHQQPNTDTASAKNGNAAGHGNAATGKARADGTVQLPDAATKTPALNGDATAAKPAASTASAASEKAQSNAAPLHLQAQAAADSNADDFAASVEKHALLARAGAKRAAELHQMKLRLDAHRSAIKKTIAQSTAATGNQQQSAASAAGKPVIEVTASATPPAAAALDGPAARPATLFNATAPGALPGQPGSKGPQGMATGDIVGTSAGQSAGVADRQSTVANAARSLGARPAPAQPNFQPAEQVKVHIQQLVKSGHDRIHIKLSPASLGRVEVALEMGPDKTVHAVVYADKHETLDMLERDARVLQRAFEEAGMKFDSDSLAFQHGRPGNPEAQLSQGDAPADAGAVADGDGPVAGDSAESDLQPRRQHDGMLDLEI